MPLLTTWGTGSLKEKNRGVLYTWRWRSEIVGKDCRLAPWWLLDWAPLDRLGFELLGLRRAVKALLKAQDPIYGTGAKER